MTRNPYSSALAHRRSPYSPVTLRGTTQSNPSPGWSAVWGSAVGNVTGAALGWFLVRLTLPKAEDIKTIVDIEDATEAEAQEVVDVELPAVVERVAKWNRKRHWIMGLSTTALAATGAFVGARMVNSPQAGLAALGAGVGTAVARGVGIAANGMVSPPGLLLGGVGAYLGARERIPGM